jgi:hypothetical protein
MNAIDNVISRNGNSLDAKERIHDRGIVYAETLVLSGTTSTSTPTRKIKDALSPTSASSSFFGDVANNDHSA